MHKSCLVDNSYRLVLKLRIKIVRYSYGNKNSTFDFDPQFTCHWDLNSFAQNETCIGFEFPSQINPEAESFPYKLLTSIFRNSGSK